MKIKYLVISLIVLALSLMAVMQCANPPASALSITKTEFGKLPDGRRTDLYTLSNSNGMSVSITNYGGIVTKVLVPDQDGNIGDVVLGYDSVEGYLKQSPYFGALIGRYGNRIAKGRFTLDGREYKLATNNDANHLHGGDKGFDKVLWNAAPVREDDKVSLELTYTSPDGEEGYPGTLSVRVVYTLMADNILELDFQAETDKKTICNLTNHAYFNLKDAGASPILDHKLYIDADHFTPVDSTLIPTGELRPVEGTPFDFTEPTAIGARIDSDNTQLVYGNGYDHNFVLNNQDGDMTLAARVTEPATGRALEIQTTEPGIQFYCGNFLDGTITGKYETVYDFRHGFCLETQHYPDSPNQPKFPSTVLNPGETYHTKTSWKFSTVE